MVCRRVVFWVCLVIGCELVCFLGWKRLFSLVVGAWWDVFVGLSDGMRLVFGMVCIWTESYVNLDLGV